MCSNYSSELGARSKCRCLPREKSLQGTLSTPLQQRLRAKCRLPPCDTITRALEQISFSPPGANRHSAQTRAINVLPARARAGEITGTPRTL